MIFGRSFLPQPESSEPTGPNRTFSTSGWTSFPLNRFLVDSRPNARRPVWRLRIGPAHLVWAYRFSGSEPFIRSVGPVCSMNCRVIGTGVDCMGWPIYSKAHQADGIELVNSTNKFREVVHRAGDRAGLPAHILISVEKMGLIPAFSIS